MADYTALMEAGSALVEMLRDNLTPEPLGDRELISLCSPHESENNQLTVYLYHVEEESPNLNAGYYQADRDIQRIRPARYALRYLITAHSKAPSQLKEADQHRILGAALQTIPQDQYEAAQIDGASSWQSFRYVTAPHIRTVVGLLVVLRTVWVFNNFDIIYMITGGGPAGASTTMPIFIYDTGWTGRLVGKASAASILLLLFLVILCVLYFTVINRWEKEDK